MSSVGSCVLQPHSCLDLDGWRVNGSFRGGVDVEGRAESGLSERVKMLILGGVCKNFAVKNSKNGYRF